MKRVLLMMTMVLSAALLLGAPLAAQAAPAAQSAGACDGGEGVYLYDLPDYQGRCIKLTSSSTDLSEFGFNNVASSIRLVGSWTATLFVDQGYGGASSSFAQSDTNLSNNTVGTDQASSIDVRRGTSTDRCDGGEGVYLYDLPDYQGVCLKLTSSNPDLSNLGFNNVASSIRLVGSWTATLFVSQNYGDVASTFTQSDTNLANDTVGDNRASSILVARGGAPAGNVCDGGEGVYLYEHPSYQGRCVKLTADAPDLRTLGFDDIASSVRFVGSWTATLYRDLSGTGIATIFIGDNPNIINDPVGDNQVTSVRVQRAGVPAGNGCDGGEGVYLYEHPSYQGRCVKFTADAPDLRTLGFDDIASSVRFVGSWTATLYRDLSGTGIATTFTTDDSNIIDDPVGDNQVTSVRVQRGRVPTSSLCDGGEGVYLYEHPSYQGRCVKFTADAPDLRPLGFDDIASSIRFVGGWTATLYRDLNGTGIASSFSGDDSNIIDDPVGDNQVTSVRVQRR